MPRNDIDSVLDRYFNIFEGARDEAYRTMALDAFKATLDGLRDIPEIDMDSPKGNSPVTSVNIGDTSGNDSYSELEMHFIAKEEDAGKKSQTYGRFIQGSGNKPSVIEMNVYVPSDVLKKLDAKSWKKVVKKNATVIMSRMKEAFLHEFIHYLDLQKIDPKSRPAVFGKASLAAKSNELNKYYTHPLEYNAFVQQGLAKIQDHLAGERDPEKIKKVIGSTPTEFYKLVLKVIPHGMKTAMDEKYKAKLKKRVAQMWNDLMKGKGE